MESFGFFSFALLWLGLPAAWFVLFRKVKALGGLDGRLRRLEQEQWEVLRRVATLERNAVAPDPRWTPAPASESVPEMAPPPILASEPTSPPPPPPSEPDLETAAPAAEPAVVPSSMKASFDWEQFVGVKLFAWLGGLALFFAAAFGLSYSIEHNLVPPALRAFGGFLLGTGLVATAWLWRREGDRIVSQSLGATGVLILYATLFACRVLFHFEAFSLGLTFFLMSMVTAVAFTFAVRRNAQVVAVLGMLGGFLTPVMLSTGVDSPGGLFGYIAILNVGLLAVVRARRWNHLLSLAALGTAALQLGWYGRFFAPEKIGIAQLVFLGFPLLFVAGWAMARREGWLVKDAAGAPALLALVAMGISFNLVLGHSMAAMAGQGFVVAFGADLLLLVLAMATPALAGVEMLGAVLVFTLDAFWSLDGLRQEQMPLALALPLGISALHTVGPLCLRGLVAKDVPATRTSLYRQLIPAAGLLLLLVPILRELSVSYLLWGCVLVVNAFAMALAWVTGAVLGLLAVFVLSAVLIATWLLATPVQALEWTESLVVIGGAAVVFLGLSAVWLPGMRSLGQSNDAAEERMRRWMPGLSALMPFALLILLVLRFMPVDPTSVFAVAAGLVAVIFGLVRLLHRTAPPRLLLASLLGVSLLEAAWIGTGVARGAHWAGPVAWMVGFHLAFLAYPFVFQRTVGTHRLPWVVAAASGPIAFLWVYARIHAGNAYAYPGLIPACFAIPSALALVRVWRDASATPELQLTQRAWMAGMTLLFVTLIVPIQFHHDWLTLGWALEGAALCALARRVPHRGLRTLALTLLGIAFVRMALHPTVWEMVPRAETRLFNPAFYTFTTVIAALFAASRWLPASQSGSTRFPERAILASLGTVLLFLLVNVEIADWFSPGLTRTFQFSDNLGRDLAHTIAWGLFAFALIVLGIARRLSGARYAGLGLLVITLGKLFLHDLANLGSLYRIAAFAGVAVIAMVASFLYQRFLTRNA